MRLFKRTMTELAYTFDRIMSGAENTSPMYPDIATRMSANRLTVAVGL